MPVKYRVELACHTGYSRMDGIGFGSDIVEFAAKNNIKTLVITDNGNIDGYVDLQRNIARWKEKGLDIKLIMGVDLNVIDDREITGNVVNGGRLSVLIRDEAGKKNLYKILSEGERKYKNEQGEIEIPLSLLLENREGLLIGSGSSSEGLIIYSHNMCKIGENTLGRFSDCEYEKDIYNFLDYIEVPCDDISSAAKDELFELADYYKIPAVGICAPHYMRHEENEAYSVLKNITWDDHKHYRDTEEMLEMFDYLGKDKAYEIVVTNSNIIAGMCEEVSAVPNTKMYPMIANQDEILKNICEKSLPEKYEVVTPEIRERLKWELYAIASSESAFMFVQIKDVIDRLGLLPFEIGSRGSVGSSLVAFLCGISEVDPIKANLCPYFFFGIKGDKQPDIDLNFGAHIQKAVHDIFTEAPGVGSVIKAGTFGTISEGYAERMIETYSEENKRYFFGTHKNEIIDSLTKCVRTRGQHPGGLILLPEKVDVTDICPVTCLNGENSNIESSAFDYHSIDNVTYKFDALGHNSPEILKHLYDLTGVDPRTISLEDPDVMEMFKVAEGNMPGCAGIPEFSTQFAFNSLKTAKCQSFDDLVKLCGLMHGTDVWLGNAENLIKEGIVTISDVLADRNDVYDMLRKHDVDEETAFKISEDVRKGKVSHCRSSIWENTKQLLIDKGLPEWFIFSCEKICYMFPRAHSYSYIMAAWRMAWYKLHYPLEFYLVMLNISNGTGFDVNYMAYGKEKMDMFVDFLNSDYASERPFVMEARKTCVLLHDYYDCGYKFYVSETGFGNGERFRILDEHTIEVDGSKCIRSSDSYDDDEMYFY